MQKVFEPLNEKFMEIYKKGWIKSVNTISSGVGMTLEKQLGKEPDDFAFPDFNGIEIKSQRINSSFPITLFGLAPDGEEFPEIDRLRRKFGYFDYDKEEDRKLNVEFYCSKNILICNRYFFNLEVNRDEQRIYLIIKNINQDIIEKKSYWQFNDLKGHLNDKLKYLGFIHAATKNKMNSEYFRYFRLECYILKDFDVFLKLIEQNIICVSITTSPVKYGPSIGSQRSSCYFRINKFDLPKLFDLNYVNNCYNYMHF